MNQRHCFGGAGGPFWLQIKHALLFWFLHPQLTWTFMLKSWLMCFLKTRKRKNGVNWLALSPSWRSCCGALCCCGVVVHMSAQAHWLRTQRSQLDGLFDRLPRAFRMTLLKESWEISALRRHSTHPIWDMAWGLVQEDEGTGVAGPRSSPSAAQFVQGFFLPKKTAKTKMQVNSP